MEENNSMYNENIPEFENIQAAEPEMVEESVYAEEPVYAQPAAEQEPERSKKPRKAKKGKTGLIVLLVVGALLLGVVAGGLITGGTAKVLQNAVVVDADSNTAQPPSYELVPNALPQSLGSNQTGKSLTPVEVYRMTVNSVVGITTESTTNIFGQEAVSASAGSGFILTEDGYIVTNSHVVSGADSIKVAFYNGDSLEAKLVGSDAGYDIAVLKVEATGLPAVSVGDSDLLQVGEEVAAIGNPLGELTFTMTNGILSALDREINTDGNPQNMLQTNAAINSGNSGGPLFDMDANVIGVTTAKYSGSTSSGTTIEGLGFAIPINTALRVAYDLVEHGFVKGEAYLGVTLRSLTSDTASYYGLPLGPRVEEVISGSCAETAGILVGDIIIAYNGESVANHTALKAALKKNKAGDTVELTVFRAGAELVLTVTLDEKPAQEVLDAQVQDRQEQETTQQPQQQQPETWTEQIPNADIYDPFGFFRFFN